jgi:O-acetyl-ADP-ribose deacetylase (regulator of RNase III)
MSDLRAIEYVSGDATLPQGPGPRIIAHGVNNRGAWGAGFVIPLGKRYPEAERAYHSLFFPNQHRPLLGTVQLIGDVEAPGIFVANMFTQDLGGPQPVSLGAVRQCLYKVRKSALAIGASVHMPRICCGLGGREWGEIEPLIEEELCGHEVLTYVYDLPT